MSNPVQLTIEPKVVEGIVGAQIQAAIVAQFNKAPGMLEAMVAHIIGKKVDAAGRVSTYDYDNKHQLLEILCQNAIKTEAENALREWVKEHSDEIRATFHKHLNSKKSDIVKLFVESAMGSLKTNFHVQCSVSMNAPEKR